MPLILRVDVDKPFGSSSLSRRIISKLRENAWFPPLGFLGYDHTSRRFAGYLHEKGIPAIFFFRLCTIPPKIHFREYLTLGHIAGLHAENTRTDATFLDEIERFKQKTGLDRIVCFTKHGSGVYRLGRRHHAPYEEDKYRRWDRQYKIRFPFGNGMISSNHWREGAFFTEMFWMHPSYRDTETFTVDWAIAQAKEATLGILIHPENYYAIPRVKHDFDRLIALSKQHRIAWTVTLPQDEQSEAS